jgi:hypothetical protein
MVCLAKTSYTYKMNDLAQTSIRTFRYDSGYDRPPTFPRLDGELCIAKIRSAFEMNGIRESPVTIYMDDIQP